MAASSARRSFGSGLGGADSIDEGDDRGGEGFASTKGMNRKQNSIRFDQIYFLGLLRASLLQAHLNWELIHGDSHAGH